MGYISMNKIIVIGGVAAGMSAASKAKRVNSSLEIKVYTEENDISYSACSLPYLAKNIISDERELIARTPEQMADRGIQVFANHKVTTIDPERKKIKGINKKGVVFSESYDRLIIATGSVNIVPPLKNIMAPGVFSIKNIPDIHEIQNYIEKWDCKHAVIVGGGFIGIEMADALNSIGLEVKVVEKMPQIMSIFDEDIALELKNYITSKGVDVRCNLGVTEILTGKSGRVTGVYTDTGIKISADIVILAIGLKPNTALAKSAGIELGARGAIRVNEYMETSIKDIYAAGDCVTSINLVTNKETNVCLGTVANRNGKICGENIAGGHKKYKGEIGTTVFKIFEKEGAKTGLNLKEAQTAGLEVFDTTIISNTRASGYPGRGRIIVKLVIEKATGRVIGGEIFGDEGSAKRIDVIAAYVQLKQKIGELATLDMGYAPPFSPVWDPILVAASQAETISNKLIKN